MHIIQVIRHYLGLTQQELARQAGISQPDLCEMEIKDPESSTKIQCNQINIVKNE